MDEPGMALAGLAGYRNRAGHLDPERKVLPKDVPDACGHGDTPCCRLLLELPVIGRIDTAVNESSQHNHWCASVDGPFIDQQRHSGGAPRARSSRRRVGLI